MSQIIEVLSASTFEAATATGKTTLVEFGAQWCGPCKQMEPILVQIAAENDDIAVVKVDIDSASDIAQQYQITSVPTMIVYNSAGEPVERFSGAVPKAKLVNILKGA